MQPEFKAACLFIWRRRICLIGICLASGLLLNCMGTGLPSATAEVRFETATLCLARQSGERWDILQLEGELARTLEQRARGLMDRDQLPAQAGMLFLYEHPQSGRQGFWMYRTRIPLDIAYLDEEGRILSILQMQPCMDQSMDDCPTYPAGQRFSAALEVNSGYFANHGVREGDRLWISKSARCSHSPKSFRPD